MHNPNQVRYKKWVAGLAALIAILPVLSACSFGSKDNPNERRTLRIGMAYGSKDSEEYYRRDLTDMFELTHKNIDIEFVNAIDYSDMQFATEEERKKAQQVDPNEKLRGIMTGDNPVDVVLTDLGSLSKLVEDNLLKPLDPYIKEDKMDLSDFLPNVLDAIREQGNGQLYGLSPTFYSSALFYNKKLFAKANVNPPTDGMSWDDVFTLARSMKSGTGKDAVYGFNLSSWGGGLNYYDVQYQYADPLKLRMFDAAGEKMTVNTEQWKKALSKPFNLYKDHVMPHPEDFQNNNNDGRYNPYQNRPFFQGKVAMEIGGYYNVNDLIAYNKNVDKMKGAEKLEWDVVTLPSHPEAQGGGNIGLGSLLVINAKGHNPKDAWEFIKHYNSEEVAKFKARSNSELSVRQKYIKPKDGENYHVEAFTSVKPGSYARSDADVKLYQERPNLNMIQEIGQIYFQQATEGKISLDDALAKWETKGNDLLQKIKLNPTGDLNAEMDSLRQESMGGMSGERAMVRAAAGG
ncbi:ABC transporter substrate-binding protein [Cohnella nanjingensis]|uniref:Extracellular solute-binding protein n=1 Tax=Cohnella nanjingensis TaxID=1387779 RepID=A0A7X0VI07_9BACL|nr:extracellular solute-binding protein [Cohnella nanjingensis]MBB6673179.1 extracellular solute-binding protein [Cohnella nanjingensis]